MDLSKVPTEDLQAISKGDFKSVSTPGLQAYQAAMQHESQAQTQSLNPQQIPDAADKAAQNNSPNAKPVSLVNNKNFPSSYGGGGMTAQAAQDNPDANKFFAKLGTGLALGAVGGAATSGIKGAAGFAARTGANAAGSGLQQYFGNLMDNKPATQGVGGAALLGGGISAGLGVLGSAAKWFGDKAMKASTGVKDVGDAGTRLADMGLWGTKGMMANQVSSKLPEAENEVQAVVGDIPGTASGSEIANAVSGKGTRFINPDTGLPFEGKETSYNQVRELADKLGNNKSYSPEALLKLKRASDYEGYTASGTPATSLKAELEQAQADKARELLFNMSSGASKEALANEQALLLAKKSLEKAASIPSSLGALLFQKAPALVGSSAGQISTKVGQGLNTTANPAVLQGLFGAAKGSQ